jgi:serine/threonine protein kinase
LFTREHPHVCSPFLSPFPGRELATGRKIAIKKIKVGQFKDGLDMSAVREVKYLRELHHPNIIEVRILRAH